VKIVRYQVLVQMLGAVGVTASLLFVGFELKQSRDIAVADIYQQRTVMWIDHDAGLFSPEQFESAFNKLEVGNVEFSAFDILVLETINSARFTIYENSHFQYQLGLVTEEEWAATKLNISGDLTLELGCRVNWWQRQKKFWRKSFVSEVDMLLSQVDIPPCHFPQFQDDAR
jgi:hypothetical protein